MAENYLHHKQEEAGLHTNPLFTATQPAQSVILVSASSELHSMEAAAIELLCLQKYSVYSVAVTPSYQKADCIILHTQLAAFSYFQVQDGVHNLGVGLGLL